MKNEIFDKMKLKGNLFTMVFGIFVLLVGVMSTASAYVIVDGVSFDPAIITAGDEVTIIASMHTEGENLGYQTLFEDDVRYEFKAILIAEDSIAKENVIVIDDGTNNNLGLINPFDRWNSKFKVKVAQDAPVGHYKMIIQYRYYLDGEPVGDVLEKPIYLDVTKEGIIAGISNMNTNPLRVRPGDEFVEILLDIENSGLKDSKNVEVTLSAPKGITPSYTNNNRVWVGVLGASESKPLKFVVDVTDEVLPGTYDLSLDMTYMDLENNHYETDMTLSFLIKEKPQLEVVSSEGSGLLGGSTKLKITVKNTGTETAEFVDVRVLKQSSQAFDFGSRSSYIGDLEPGETGLAIFDVDISYDSEMKDHDVKLILRAKGDSDKGDENIYTFSRRATLNVNGVAPNLWKIYGIYVLVLFIIVLLVNKIFFSSKKEVLKVNKK